VRVGDRLRAGSALLEVTKPRRPCFKLAAHMGIPEFPRLFLKSARSGWYARVVEEGDVGAGDRVERETGGAGPPVIEALRQAAR
jgi:MOSC domain-containing protein YiiM